MEKVELLKSYINRSVPYAWNDSESWYEFLGKVYAKVNELVSATNAYFDIDLKAYTEQILDEWYADGKLSTIISETLGQSVAVVQAELESLELDYASTKEKTADIYKLVPTGTSDSANFALAIASGKRVELSKGSTYILTEPLTLTANTHINGNGATIDYQGIGNCIYGYDVDNIKLENFKLLQTIIATETTSAVVISMCENVDISNVHIRDFALSVGFFITGCKYVTVEKSSVKNTGINLAQGGGILLGYNQGYSCESMNISNCEFNNNGGSDFYHGVYFSALKVDTNNGNINISNNTISGNKGAGIQINETGGNIVISNNYLDGNKERGINLVNSYNVIIESNIIKNCGAVGTVSTLTCAIYMSNSPGFANKNVKILNNIIDGVFKTSQAGASCFGVNLDKYTEFSGNTVNNVEGKGLIVAGGTDANIKIQRNTISNIDGHGIDIRGNLGALLTNALISDNLIINCGRTVTWSSGVYIDYLGYCIISDNVFDDTQTVKTMHNAINGGSGENVGLKIANNTFHNLTAGILAKEQKYTIDEKGFPLNWGSAPTTGLWKKGDIFLNSNLIAGGFLGYVCIAGDGTTLGTWKGFGLIQA